MKRYCVFQPEEKVYIKENFGKTKNVEEAALFDNKTSATEFKKRCDCMCVDMSAAAGVTDLYYVKKVEVK